MNLVQYSGEKTELITDTVLLDDVEIKGIDNDEYASTKEVWKAINFAYKNDPRLHTKLLYYALKKIRLYFRKDAMGLLNAEDIVQVVIIKLIEGERKWNKKKFDIYRQLMMSIFSFIRNEYKRIKTGKHITYISYFDEDGMPDENITSGAFEDCIYKELENNEFQRIERCRASLEAGNDADAYYVFEEMLKQINSNMRIAENLNLTVKDVENAKKRIRRIVNKEVLSSEYGVSNRIKSKGK